MTAWSTICENQMITLGLDSWASSNTVDPALMLTYLLFLKRFSFEWLFSLHKLVKICTPAPQILVPSMGWLHFLFFFFFFSKVGSQFFYGTHSGNLSNRTCNSAKTQIIMNYLENFVIYNPLFLAPRKHYWDLHHLKEIKLHILIK